MRRTLKRSQVPDQIPDANAQCFGDAHQGLHAGSLLPALQLAQVHRMQVRLLGEPLLGQPGPLAVASNCFPNDPLVTQGCSHALSPKQEAPELNTVHSPSFAFHFVVDISGWWMYKANKYGTCRGEVNDRRGRVQQSGLIL